MLPPTLTFSPEVEEKKGDLLNLFILLNLFTFFMSSYNQSKQQ